MLNNHIVDKLNARARNRWIISEILPLLIVIVVAVLIAFTEFAIRNG